MQLYHGDCLVEMEKIPDHSVDMILCDLPYGTTACKWDVVIPFEPLWEHYWRVLKPNGAVVLFGSEPFSSYLRVSQIDRWKYDWIWKKNRPTGFMQAKRKPLKSYEIVSVFGEFSVAANHGRHGIYNLTLSDSQRCPQIERGRAFTGERKERLYKPEKTGYPWDILEYKCPEEKLHPTQKPVALLEYLVKTYTDEGETVLDNCMGSGSTGVACINTKRNFIGIEKDEKYFEIAKNRIETSMIN